MAYIWLSLRPQIKPISEAVWLKHITQLSAIMCLILMYNTSFLRPSTQHRVGKVISAYLPQFSEQDSDITTIKIFLSSSHENQTQRNSMADRSSWLCEMFCSNTCRSFLSRNVYEISTDRHYSHSVIPPLSIPVCGWSLSYQPRKAHAPYCHLLPVYHIFPHYHINDTTFVKKKIEHKMCFVFLYNFCLKHFSY